MVEKGIFIEGVPLGEYLVDKETRKLYLDTQAEIAGQKELIYQSRGVTMEIKHSKRPSKVRHVTRAEYYMKENIAKCSSGPEYVLTIFQDGLPQTFNSLIGRFEHLEIKTIGPSGIRQALIKVKKRYPDLFEVFKNEDNHDVYTMIAEACKIDHQHLLGLWRRKLDWNELVEKYPGLKKSLTSKILESKEATTIGFVDVLEKLDELLGRVIGMETNVTDLNDCNNGLERRVHKIEEQFLEDGEMPVNRHTLDVNINFNFGKGGE